MYTALGATYIKSYVRPTLAEFEAILESVKKAYSNSKPFKSQMVFGRQAQLTPNCVVAYKNATTHYHDWGSGPKSSGCCTYRLEPGEFLVAKNQKESGVLVEYYKYSIEPVPES